MKLKEIEMLLNERLKSLNGIKFKSGDEFHKLKQEALSEVAKRFGFNIANWSLELELGNGIVSNYITEIFEIELNSEEDKRYFYDMAGTINTVEVKLTNKMKVYADVDIKNLNTLYVRDCIKSAIENQKEVIQKKLQEIKNAEEALLIYEKEYERAEKEVLSLSL